MRDCRPLTARFCPELIDRRLDAKVWPLGLRPTQASFPASFGRGSRWRCVLCAAGCHGRDDAANRAAVANLDQALNPTFLVAALRKLGGAHFHGTTRMSVTAAATPTNEAGWDTVTTTTDLWLDRGGNYRIVETNDQDGGREVVLFGHDLSVALRYGKMVRRRAQDPEPERLLEEALGGPWSGWEVASPFAIIKHNPVTIARRAKGRGVPGHQVRKAPSQGREVLAGHPLLARQRVGAGAERPHDRRRGQQRAAQVRLPGRLHGATHRRAAQRRARRPARGGGRHRRRANLHRPDRRRAGDRSARPPRSCRCASASFPSSASCWAG